VELVDVVLYKVEGPLLEVVDQNSQQEHLPKEIPDAVVCQLAQKAFYSPWTFHQL